MDPAPEVNLGFFPLPFAGMHIVVVLQAAGKVKQARDMEQYLKELEETMREFS